MGRGSLVRIPALRRSCRLDPALHYRLACDVHVPYPRQRVLLMQAALIAMLLATPNFAGVIQQKLGLAQPPPCTICHATNAGGLGTVVKPFGIYLQSRGLVPFDDASLRNALMADIAERHSSSGGLTDVDALRAGEDPNGAPGSNLVPAVGGSNAGSSVGLLAPFRLGGRLIRRR